MIQMQNIYTYGQVIGGKQDSGHQIKYLLLKTPLNCTFYKTHYRFVEYK